MGICGFIDDLIHERLQVGISVRHKLKSKCM